MIRRAAHVLLAAAVLLSPLLCAAQMPSGRKETERVPDLPSSDHEEVLRVRTTLVELSAVVTDKGGRAVEDLRKEDFEVLENDRPRQVSFFSVEHVGGAVARAGEASPTAAKESAATIAASPTVTTSRAPAVGRTVVLFVDALHLTPSGLMQVKKVLRRFIDQQMTEGDLVAVVSTAGGAGLLGQFTRDRGLLRLAVERLQTQSAQTPSFFTPYLAAQVVREDNPEGEATWLAAKIVRAEDGVNASLPSPGQPPEYVQKVYARQKAMIILGETAQRRKVALATLRAVAERLAQMPGQRLVAYLSEGFSMVDTKGETETSDIEAVTSRAARSGVVVYALDVRGLSANPIFDASAGDVADTGRVTSQLSSYLAGSVVEAQSGMNALAKDTGGEPFFNTNDLSRALGRALDENRVYYRIAYHSSDDDGGKKFRRITVRLKNHPDYHVRTQRGYRPDAGDAAAAQTPQQRFVSAILSPLPSTAIPVDASAGFFVGGADDAQVSFRAHVDAAALDYREQADKLFHLELDVVTGVYDLSGKTVASFPEKIRSSFTPQRAELVKRYGIDSLKRLTLKPGLYQIRVGVRELSTERVGTSSVVVEVPDLSRGKLAMSSLFLRDDLNQAGTPTDFRQGLRVYRQGEPLVYQFRAYNAEGAPQDAASLSMRIELRQGERSVYAGEWQPVAPLVVKRDAKGLEVGGELRAQLPAGVYELVVSVRDERRKKTVSGTVAFAVETPLRRGAS
jgi:VWFA-related protein